MMALRRAAAQAPPRPSVPRRCQHGRMTENAHTTALSLLTRLQACVDDRDLGAFMAFFDDDPVLIGSGAHSFGRAAVHDSLAAIVAQPAGLRWDFREVRIFHDALEPWDSPPSVRSS